jgi:transposase IS116/IS110/IS902 family protein
MLIDDLERQIAELNRRLKEGHAEHPYVPLLLSVPGIGWVLAFTIAAEIGEIERFASPQKLTGYTGLCPRVNQSGDSDRRGPLSKHGPRYLRWALIEATMHALKHPAYAERYQQNKKRLGRQRGAKVAQIDIARRLAPRDLAHAHPQPEVRSPRRHSSSAGIDRPPMDVRPRANDPISPDPPAPVIDSTTAQTGSSWNSSIRRASLLSEPASGGIVSWSRCSPAPESRHTSTFLRLRSNPACNIEAGPPFELAPR